MTSLVTPTLTLDAFLALPETKPATEFIHGKVIQKPMPQGEHSRLQSKLCEAINNVTELAQIAYAFPELRCTFGGQSLVPDVAVFSWNRIPRLASGRIANRFNLAPDWSIEILSPDQSQTRVLGKLLHCVQNETQLGWLIDPTEETVLALWPDQRVQLLEGDTALPTLTNIDLALTVDQLFSWLMF